MKHKEETRGEWFLGIEVLLYAFFPLLAHGLSDSIPPLQYVAYITLLSVPLYFAIAWWRGGLKELFNREAFWYLMGVTLFVAVSYAFIFMATVHTSGVNTALLPQSEVFFAALFGFYFLGEKFTKARVIGCLLILLGNFFVLFNGQVYLNGADLVLFFTPLLFPFGNWCSKKAMEKVHWSTVLLFRSTVGGLVLLLWAQWAEGLQVPEASVLPAFFFMGIFVFGVAKIFWCMALQRMDMSKTVAIGKTDVALSVLLAYPVLGELPTLYQIVGLILVAIGTYFVLLIRSKQYTVSA